MGRTYPSNSHDSALELHTGIDAFGPRKRFIYTEHDRVYPWLETLEFMDKAPDGWIRKIRVPRYLAILQELGGSNRLGVCEPRCDGRGEH